MRYLHVPLLVWLQLMLWSTNLLAERPSISVDEILSRALEESPVAKEIDTKIALRRSEGLALKTLENPLLDSEVRIPVSYEGDRGSDEVTVALSQPLRLSNFGVRDRINLLIQEAGDNEKRLLLLEFTQNIRLAFAKTWALSRREAEIEAIRRRALELEQSIAEGSSKGLYGTGEAKIFRAEVLKLQNEKVGIRSDLNRARIALARTVGFLTEAPLKQPSLEEPPSNDTDFADFPTVERVRLLSRIADAQARLARLDRFPSFAPRIVYERTQDRTDFVGLGVSVELPLFNRNQPQRLSKESEARQAKTLLNYYEGDGFKTEVQLLRTALVASIAQAQSYKLEVLPALQEALLAQENLLQSGQGSVFQVWQTLRELSNAESQAVELLIKAYAERAEFVVVTGKEF